MNPYSVSNLTGKQDPFLAAFSSMAKTGNAPTTTPTTPLTDPFQVAPEPQTKKEIKPINWTQLRGAIIKKYPNLSKSQLEQLDSVLKKRQVKEAVELGITSPKDIAKDYYDIAVEAVRNGIPVEGLAGGGVTGTPAQIFTMNQGLKSLDEVEKLYGRGDPENIGAGKSLALAANATRFGKVGSSVNALFKSFADSEYQEDLNKYNNQVNLLIGGLTQLSGSGAPQADEAKRLLQNIPTPNSTEEEAKAWFAAIRNLAGGKTTQTKNNKVGRFEVIAE